MFQKAGFAFDSGEQNKLSWNWGDPQENKHIMYLN